MPSFFRRKQPSRDSPAFRSVEHLPPSDSLDPPSVSTVNTNNTDNTNSHAINPPPAQPPSHQHHSFLRRSRSQRHPRPVDPDPVFKISAAPPRIVDADQSWPPSPAQPEDQENPRRSRRSLFTFHSSPPSKESVTYPERNQSLRNPSPGPQRRQRPLSVDTSDHQPPSRSREHVRLEKTPQSPMPQDAAFSHDHARPPRSPHPPLIQRSHTDSLETLYRASPIDPPAPRHPAELTPGQPPTDHIRPPSRQSVGPPSPLRPLPVNTDGASSSAMSDRPSGGAQGPPANQGSAQETGYRSGPGQTSEPGRSTPSSQRGRDEEIELKTVLQKYDELQAKYSKVKRYYFEKDAQVQHLQNTVAHQRMAVSRTVLDDNEYANRFGRLDGAIKDLAFSIRKDWARIPPWFAGYVNEDAHQAGTKEMMAIGRAVMSRWLVEELFERYFHPALDMTLSQQLKTIEMNLRRQQGKTYTDEDKENAIARISNWRRTTLDGLPDALQGPAADEHRTQLINRLVDGLVATLTAHLCDPPPAGLDSAARMIVENAVGIVDKIPLESRDICVEYVLPGTPIQELTMKVETGIKPLGGADARASTDQERAEGDEPAEGEPENRSKRSVFSALMNRGSRAAPTEDAGRPEERGPPRVRLATFVLAEVRGRGPMNVLVKAPVYAME
ncbi:hypothetical protein HFD88_001077 [Aspergillus terreus]|nr:hypothetical protein HFD88_001077 [Aspergillus terreus]